MDNRENARIASNEVAERTPKSVLRYLSEKHLTLLNDYKKPDGNGTEMCNYIAMEIRKLFNEAGCEAKLIQIRKELKRGQLVPEMLVPIPYQGRVRWSCHVVCCSGGLAYDPIIGAPIPLEDYAKTVFGDTNDFVLSDMVMIN